MPILFIPKRFSWDKWFHAFFAFALAAGIFAVDLFSLIEIWRWEGAVSSMGSLALGLGASLVFLFLFKLAPGRAKGRWALLVFELLIIVAYAAVSMTTFYLGHVYEDSIKERAASLAEQRTHRRDTVVLPFGQQIRQATTSKIQIVQKGLADLKAAERGSGEGAFWKMYVEAERGFGNPTAELDAKFAGLAPPVALPDAPSLAAGVAGQERFNAGLAAVDADLLRLAREYSTLGDGIVTRATLSQPPDPKRPETGRAMADARAAFDAVPIPGVPTELNQPLESFRPADRPPVTIEKLTAFAAHSPGSVVVLLLYVLLGVWGAFSYAMRIGEHAPERPQVIALTARLVALLKEAKDAQRWQPRRIDMSVADLGRALLGKSRDARGWRLPWSDGVEYRSIDATPGQLAQVQRAIDVALVPALQLLDAKHDGCAPDGYAALLIRARGRKDLRVHVVLGAMLADSTLLELLFESPPPIRPTSPRASTGAEPAPSKKATFDGFVRDLHQGQASIHDDAWLADAESAIKTASKADMRPNLTALIAIRFHLAREATHRGRSAAALEHLKKIDELIDDNPKDRPLFEAQLLDAQCVRANALADGLMVAEGIQYLESALAGYHVHDAAWFRAQSALGHLYSLNRAYPRACELLRNAADNLMDDDAVQPLLHLTATLLRMDKLGEAERILKKAEAMAENKKLRHRDLEATKRFLDLARSEWLLARPAGSAVDAHWLEVPSGDLARSAAYVDQLRWHNRLLCKRGRTQEAVQVTSDEALLYGAILESATQALGGNQVTLVTVLQLAMVASWRQLVLEIGSGLDDEHLGRLNRQCRALQAPTAGASAESPQIRALVQELIAVLHLQGDRDPAGLRSKVQELVAVTGYLWPKLPTRRAARKR